MKILKYTAAALILTSSLSAADLSISRPKGAVLHDISVKILAEAYKNAGIGVKFIEMPGARSIKDSNAGKNDGEATRIKAITKKFKNLVRVPVVINQIEAMVFTKDKKFDVNGWASLKPYKIGIGRGSKFAEKGTEGMDVQALGTYAQAFKLLDKGRIDIIVSPKVTGMGVMKKLGLKGITMLDKPIVKLDLYHYLHKKNEGVVPKIEAELKKMKDSGAVKDIREKFIATLK